MSNMELPRVLLLTPSFFGYERAIADEFEQQGFEVVLADERPSNTSMAKAAVRVYPPLIGRAIAKHYRSLRQRLLGTRLDLAIIVKAEVVPVSFLMWLREQNPGIVITFYAFDSFRNSPRGRHVLQHVDRAYSFDRLDAREIPGLSYKPLFYTEEYYPRPEYSAPTYDFAFVGTVHSGRYRIAQQIFAAGRKNYGFFFSPARWHHYLERGLNRDVRSIPLEDVSFDRMSRADVAKVFRDSRAVVDVQRDGQAGLTMRTFEVLASGSRLVTSNHHVMQEPFYDPRWVYVLDRDDSKWDIDGLRRFVSQKDVVPLELMSNYSLSRWVSEFAGLVPYGRMDENRRRQLGRSGIIRRDAALREGDDRKLGRAVP
jgi:hypothetical protein